MERCNLDLLLVLSVFLFALSGAELGAPQKYQRRTPPANLTTVDNGIVRVGVDSNRGGSITYFSGQLLNQFT